MASALAHNYSYHLVTRVNLVEKQLRLDGGHFANAKSLAYRLVLASVEKDFDPLVVLSDAYDVVFQQDASILSAAFDAMDLTNRGVLFGAENACWPATCSSEAFFRCPLMQGLNYLQNRSLHEPFICELQRRLAPANATSVFLNAGVSVGRAHWHRRIADQYFSLVSELPDGCLDEQAVYSWLFASSTKGVFLDHSAALVTSAFRRIDDLSFDEARGSWISARRGTAAPILHFNGDKDPFGPSVRRLFDWLRRRHGRDGFRRLLDRPGRLFVDGVQRTFNDFCPNFA